MGSEMESLIVAKIVFRKFDKKQKVHPLVQRKVVTGPDGKTRTIRTLDAGSGSFSDDLRYVFSKNVERIRRNNKKVVGVTDFVPRDA